MKSQRFDRILFKNYFFLILFCSLCIGLLSAFLDIKHTMKNERGIISESLEQAQINLNNHIEMVEDYLSLTHANSVIQENLIANDLSPQRIASRIATINNTLFYIDPFKKSIDSMTLFAFSSEGIYPEYSANTKYSNAVFSSAGIADELWFTNTLALNGRTYWFTETDGAQFVCAARVLFSTSNPSRSLGVIKATISLDKFSYHLSRISFGNQGDTYLQTGEQLFLTTNNSQPYNVLTKENSPIKNGHSHLHMERPLISGWKVIGVIPFWELYKNVFRSLLMILLTLGAATGIALFISLRISKRISSPITQLCKNMQSMQKSDVLTYVHCIEINQLYETYHSMLLEMEQLIKTREETAVKLKQAELSALQSQINPHFIYNTLESINALVATKNSKDASSMISGLSSFLRSSLNNGNNLISLKKEIQQAVSYFKIQKFRYSNRIELKLKIPDHIPEYQIIKLILQPFIENCIVHGFKDIDYIGIITLTLDESDNQLILSVSDNGLGSDIEMMNYLLKQRTLYREDNVNFYCIQNVYQRLQNCYGDGASIYYEENEHGGVTVRLFFDKEILKTRGNFNDKNRVS